MNTGQDFWARILGAHLPAKNVTMARDIATFEIVVAPDSEAFWNNLGQSPATDTPPKVPTPREWDQQEEKRRALLTETSAHWSLLRKVANHTDF